MLDPSSIDQFHAQGYVIARNLFSSEEAVYYRDHFTDLRRRGTYPGDSAGVDIEDLTGATDPLKRYPRMIHMHRWDTPSRQWLLDDRLNAWLTTLTGSGAFCRADHALL